jgi:hypothetical protein
VISAQMQRQHRHLIVDQRWSSSRLSLLTASLQIALDEPRIYEILSAPEGHEYPRLAMVVLFEAIMTMI